MKKTFIYIGIVALSVISCNKSEETIEVPEGKYLFKLNATTEMITKTSYTGESTFRWSDNDEISLLFHNTAVGHEDENEFYTLTTTSGGSNSASFSGLIDEGWEVGASDTKTKWALYPAGAHSYTEGDDFPTFNIPETTDFTASHVSANLPMATDGEGGYTFRHLTNAFKFTFNNIDVSKVKLVVENQASLNLSGDTPVRDAGTREYYLEYGSSSSKTITLIKNVSSKSVDFYVPYRIYNDSFRPVLTLYDASNNYTIKTVTAGTDFSSVSTGDRLFKDRRIIVVPSISAPGEGTPPFVPLININGDMSDWDPASNDKLTASNIKSSTGNSYFKEIKVAYDQRYVYVYIKRNRDNAIWGSNQGYYYLFLDTDNNSSNGVTTDGAKYDYGLYFYPFAGTAAKGDSPAVPGFITSGTTSVAGGYTLGGGISFSSDGTYDATDVEIETRFLRSDFAIDKDDIINIAAYGNKSANSTPYTKITDFSIGN